MKYNTLNIFSKSTLFTFFLIGILSGIALFNVSTDSVLSLLALSFLFLISTLICLQFRQIFWIMMFVVVWWILWILAWWYNGHITSSNIDKIQVYSWLYNTYQGELVKVHRRTDYYDEYLVCLKSIETREISWKILYTLRVPKNFKLEPGQVISHQWVMYEIEDFDGFSYKNYMLSQGIYFSSSTNTIDTISHDTKSIVYKMYLLREDLLWRIVDIFPSRESIFLWWILFWARENIPVELKEDFNNSGLTHFIAVSGFNITLCIIFISYLFWFLPVYVRSVLVVVSIVAFSFFVWLWAPVVRAAIMGILWYIFLQSWNQGRTITLIAFTAVVMTLMSPLSLNYDVSLHLSFLAVIGIVYTQEIFMKLFSWVPSTFAIREAFVLTLSALSFSLPIMMFQFGQISLLAPIANIAVTWTIPLAMLWWALTLIVDFISPALWEILWYLTWILLRYDIAMVELFWNIDSALLRFDFGPYASYLQAWYFILLIYFLAYYQLYKRNHI